MIKLFVGFFFQLKATILIRGTDELLKYSWESGFSDDTVCFVPTEKKEYDPKSPTTQREQSRREQSGIFF